MWQAAKRALLAWMLCCAVSGPHLPAAASTLPGIHGPGAAAVADNTRVLPHNPALLTQHQSMRLWTGLQSQSRLENLQGEWIQPTLSGAHWGVGFLQQRTSANDTWGQRALGGLGLRVHPRVSLGVGLELWNGESQRDFGGHLGALFDTELSPRTQVHLAATARNLLEPQSDDNLEQAARRRSVDLAAALDHSWSPVWSVVTSAGLRSGKDLRPSTSVAAVLRWKERLECGVGWQTDAPRIGLGWRNEVWSVGWSMAVAEDNQTHDVGVTWTWGPSLHQRRAALQEQRETSEQVRVDAAVTAFQAQQRTQWKDRAAEATASGDLERAASFYGMVLTSDPEDADAQNGFKRSRHGMLVAEADSLVARHDYGGAARALEAALHMVPADSSSAVRLREVRLASRLAFRQQSDAEQLFRRGIDAFAQQDYLQAISAFRGVLALDPEHHMASSYLSQAEQSQQTRIDNTLRTATQRMQSGDFEAARKQVHKLLAQEPDQPRALQLLSSIDATEKRVAAAERAHQEAERRRADEAARLAAAALAQETQPTAEDAAPAPPSEEIMARYDEAGALMRKGDMMAAMQAWEDVAAEVPHYKNVDKNLLRVYRVAGLERYTEGRLQEAVDIWEKALTLDPQNRQLSRYLNQAQTKLKRAGRSEVTGP